MSSEGGGKHKRGGGHGGGGGHGEGVNLERWLVSYADFMTLLFCVFVVLYAMSKVDEKRVQEVAESVTRALHGLKSAQGKGRIEPGGIQQDHTGVLSNGGSDVVNMTRNEKKVVQRQAYNRSLRLRNDIVNTLKMKCPVDAVVGLGVRISLTEQLAFTPGEAALKPDILPDLDTIAGFLEVAPNEIVIEGHTDDQPPKGSAFASNWDLSTTRATTVLRYIMEKKHLIPQERYSAAGYAGVRPLVTNDSEENRARNRRVDIIIRER